MKQGAALLLLVSLAAVIILADRRAPGKADIELQDEAVSSRTLDNGLVILAKNVPGEGLVAIDVKILAGSSLEGKHQASGISHLVEHMVFKGTPSRPAGSIEKEVKSYGGMINGSTSADITDYHILLPPQYLPEGLAILKDMLLNASLDPDEIEKEKDVIEKEQNLNEDEPQSRLLKLLNETAYTRHPYKYPTIGYREKLRELNRGDLAEYYTRMYVPNRMVVSIVGDIDESEAIKKASAEFSDMRTPDYAPLGPLPPEPVQVGPRRMDGDSRANLSYIAIGFHTTGILDEDLFATDVLSMVLGRGDNSRLNKALVKEGRLAYSVSAWNMTPRDPGMFIIYAVLDGANAEKAEEAVMAEIDRLRNGRVPDSELEAVRRMALSDLIAAMETTDSTASDMGYGYLLTGAPDFSRLYIEGIQRVSGDDLRRAANKYLDRSNMTTVRLLSAGDATPAVEAGKRIPEEKIIKETLPNGLRILLRRNTKTPAVSITAAMLGGTMAEDRRNNGISNLTANMLLKGTGRRKEDRITGRIEALGGKAEAFSGLNAFGISMEVLKPDLAEALDIMQDVLSDPAFPQEELEKEKALVLADISEEDDDVFATGLNLLRAAVYGKSPYGLRYTGTAQSVSALERDDLLHFFRIYAVPENIVLSISGDIDIAGARRMAAKLFSGLEKRSVNIPVPDTGRLDKAVVRSVEMGREQSLVLLGFETASLKSPDRYALEVLGSVLSGNSGRLFEKIRAKLALAYALGCTQKLGLGRGFLALYAATTSDGIKPARDTLLYEIRDIARNLIADEELVMAKRELLFARKVAMQSNEFIAITSALDELYGLGYDNMYRYDAEISLVTKEGIKAAAEKYLTPDACAEINII